MSSKSKQVAVPAPAGEQVFQIKAPNLRVLTLRITGTSPYVQHAFGQKAMLKIQATQMAGGQAKSKKNREPRDFDADYEAAMHKLPDGSHGMPAAAFRNGMISACRVAGFVMTRAKLAVFVLADGVGADGTPLVRIEGTPRQHRAYVRNDTGVVDIRARPMWDAWSAELRIQYDADMLAAGDVANLLMRVGAQVGIGEGRPDSKDSNGLGWGLFRIESREDQSAIA